MRNEKVIILYLNPLLERHFDTFWKRDPTFKTVWEVKEFAPATFSTLQNQNAFFRFFFYNLDLNMENDVMV